MNFFFIEVEDKDAFLSAGGSILAVDLEALLGWPWVCSYYLY